MLPRAPQSGQHSPEASKITGGGRPPRVENNWRNTLEPLPRRATGHVKTLVARKEAVKNSICTSAELPKWVPGKF